MFSSYSFRIKMKLQPFKIFEITKRIITSIPLNLKHLLWKALEPSSPPPLTTQLQSLIGCTVQWSNSPNTYQEVSNNILQPPWWTRQCNSNRNYLASIPTLCYSYWKWCLYKRWIFAIQMLWPEGVSDLCL